VGVGVGVIVIVIVIVTGWGCARGSTIGYRYVIVGLCWYRRYGH
jgi:hypothetical protein